MALLSGFDIGTNYKGILNLGTPGVSDPVTGINLPLTAVATGYKVVTDGEGNASPLQLAKDSVKITSTLNVDVNIFASTVFATLFTVSGNASVAATSASNISLYGNTGTGSFGLLRFGGETSTFPALKRSTTNLQVRLADDSGFAGLLYRTITATATVAAGATTLDCSTADIFTVTLVTSTPTAITLSNARAGTYLVRLVQPAGGSATATWSTSITWSGGAAPVLTTTANYSDIVTLIYDGTTWRGTVTYNFSA